MQKDQSIEALKAKYGVGSKKPEFKPQDYPKKKQEESKVTRFGINLPVQNFKDFDDLLADGDEQTTPHQFFQEENLRQKQGNQLSRNYNTQSNNAMSSSDLALSQISGLSDNNPMQEVNTGKKATGELRQRYENEMHLMIDDLDLPNESMTISSLSQSPWQGRSTRSYLSNLNSNRERTGQTGNANEDSSQQSAFKLTQNTGDEQNRSQEALRPPFNGSLEDEVGLELPQSILIHTQKNADRQQLKTQANEPKPLTPKNRQGLSRDIEDSPDFNRLEIVSVTDDLTMTNTDNDTNSGENNKSSYRAHGVFAQNPREKTSREAAEAYYLIPEPVQVQGITRNQNRTFADSVQSQQSQMGLAPPSDSKTTMKRNKNDYSDTQNTGPMQQVLTDTQSAGQFHIVDERGYRGRPSDATESESDISELELLAQTQLTNNLMTRGANTSASMFKSNINMADSRSRMFAQLGASSIEPDELSRSGITQGGGHLTGRTANMFGKCDDAESLNVTPDKSDNLSNIGGMYSEEGKVSKWNPNQNNLQQESVGLNINQLAGAQPIPSYDRTVDSNPLSQESSQVSSQNPLKHEARAPNNPLSDLKQRIKQQSQKQKVGGSLGSGRGLPSQRSNERDHELEQVLEAVKEKSDENSILKRQVKDLQLHVEQVCMAKDEAVAQGQKLVKRIMELESAKTSEPGGNELLKARALDAARTELREVRQTAEQYRELIEKMQAGQLNQEQNFAKEKQELEDLCKQLQLQVEQSKIISNGLRRELETKTQVMVQNDQKGTNDKDQLRIGFERQVGELETMIQNLQQQNVSLQTKTSQQAEEIAFNQSQLTQQKSQSSQLEQNCLQLQKDLDISREKNQKLEDDLSQMHQQNNQRNIIGGGLVSSANEQAAKFDTEIKRINDLHQQQVAKMKTEAQKLRQNYQEAETKVKTLELQIQNPVTQAGSDALLDLLRTAAGLTEGSDDEFVTKVSEMAETARLIEDELKLAQTVIQKHEDEAGKMKSVTEQLRSEVHELKAKAIAKPQSSEPSTSNFTNGLLRNKDIEINKLMEKVEEVQEKLWSAEQENLVLKNQYNQKSDENRELLKEIATMRQTKLKAEENVSELKTKLREALLKEQKNQLQQSQVSIEVDKLKYEELIEAVLEIDLVQDPLKEMNLSLQQSFVDEVDQAKQHLAEQIKLVQERLQQIEQENVSSTKPSSDQKLQLELEQQISENTRLNTLISQLEPKKYDREHLITILDECLALEEEPTEETLNGQIYRKIKELQSSNEVIAQSFASMEFATQTVNFPGDQDGGECLATALNEFIEGCSDESGVQSFVNGLTKKGINLSKLERLQKISNMALADQSCQTAEPLHQSPKPFLSLQDNLELRQKLNKAEEELDAKAIQIRSNSKTIQELNAKLEEKDLQKSSDQVRLQKSIETFKSEIQVEFEQKSLLLDRELREVENEKHRVIELQAELEAQIQLQADHSTKNVEFKSQETNTEHSDSALDAQKIPSNENGATELQKTNQTIKEKEREIKRLREELDRQHKVHQERIKLTKEEISVHKNQLDGDLKDKEAELTQKIKKDKEKAVEKVKADMRNQMDTIKNENLKAKAEWQREKKKLINEHDDELSTLQKDLEMARDSEVRGARDKTEKSWRKRMEDREKDFEQAKNQLENELSEAAERHREELAGERQRIESRLKETLAVALRREITKEIESELKSELIEAQNFHDEEVRQMKIDHESALKKERLVNMPKQVETPAHHQQILADHESRSEIGTARPSPINMLKDKENPAFFGASNMTADLDVSKSCLDTSNMYTEVHREQLEQQERLIDQLKINFEQELERQQVLFESQIEEKQNICLRILEELFTLECDKILQCIYFKGQQQAQEQMTIDNLNTKRGDINTLIKEILDRNENRKGAKQLSKSFGSLKKKLGLVLATLKQQLDERTNQKVDEALQKQANRPIEPVNASIQLQSIDSDARTDLISIQQSNDVFPMKLLRHATQKSGLRQQSADNHSPRQMPSKQITNKARSSATALQKATADLRQLRKVGVRTSSQEPHHMQGVRQSKDIRSQIDDGEVVIREDTIVNNFVGKSTDSHRKSTEKIFEDGQFMIQSQEHVEEGNQLWQRLGPEKQNARGAVVVEVEKVARDLNMVLNTVRTAKFCRLLLGTVPQAGSEESKNELPADIHDQKQVVKNYRDLLNDFFKLIAKLNQSSDQMSEENETYKLKLVNVNLRQKLNELQQENQGRVTRQLVEEILGFFQQIKSSENNGVDSFKESIEALEQINFQMNKLQFKLNQLADLFTTQDGQSVNKNVREVMLKCDEFGQQCGFEFFESTMPLRGSKDIFTAKKSSVVPEMLPPDQTAQLIANVVSKIGLSPNMTLPQQDLTNLNMDFSMDQQQQMHNTQFYNNNQFQTQTKSPAQVQNQDMIHTLQMFLERQAETHKKTISHVPQNYAQTVQDNNSIDYNSMPLQMNKNKRGHQTMIVEHPRQVTQQHMRPPAPQTIRKTGLKQNLIPPSMTNFNTRTTAPGTGNKNLNSIDQTQHGTIQTNNNFTANYLSATPGDETSRSQQTIPFGKRSRSQTHSGQVTQQMPQNIIMAGFGQNQHDSFQTLPQEPLVSQEGDFRQPQNAAKVQVNMIKNQSWQNRYSDEEEDENEQVRQEEIYDNQEQSSIIDAATNYDQPQMEGFHSVEYQQTTQSDDDETQQTHRSGFTGMSGKQTNLNNAQANVNSMFKRLQNKFSTVQ